jgi:hypothetical protein
MAGGGPHKFKTEILVAHLVRDEGVADSNPATPTNGISGSVTRHPDRFPDRNDKARPVVSGAKSVAVRLYDSRNLTSQIHCRDGAARKPG